MTSKNQVAVNRAAGLLEDLKNAKGFVWDAVFWAEKLDKDHSDLSFFDHAVATSALDQIEIIKKNLAELESRLKHLQSKGLK